MIFDVLTLFPEMFELFNHSIIKRAREKGILEINAINIRDYTDDKHKKVDDYPYGGGAGMVMKAQPVFSAIDAIIEKYGYKPYTILMSPRGSRYDQNTARSLCTSHNHLLFICGHYEGLDERIMTLVDEELSLGDFVLTGGELASMAIIDSISRLIPGVLSCEESFSDESFFDGLLEYPQYTRPEVFMDMKVPDVLLSGHHKNIEEWRRYESLKITQQRRPDLLKGRTFDKRDMKLLNKIKNESKNS